MIVPHPTFLRRLPTALLLLVVFLFFSNTADVAAHPLGNFSINHFTRLEADASRLRVRYVVDMAEIPTFQESQSIDTDKNGTLSAAELDAYLARIVPQLAGGLILTVDGARVPLTAVAQNISTPKGSGGLPTLRVVCDFDGDLPANAVAGQAARLRFEDTNYAGRTGWRELVVAPASGVQIFNSDAYGSAITDELKAYPQDMLAAPLDERTAEFSLTTGALPSGAAILRTRDGRRAEAARDTFAALISVPEVTPLVALLGLLLAAGFGALHAFSPGHGKTVVGAYLVGSRGTAKHAAFLGLTVTITHTLGVFALGLITLFASQYIVPERLFPILSFASGAIVLVIGLSLFIKRLRGALGKTAHAAHTHDGHAHPHAHDDTHPHAHATGHAHAQVHEHQPHAHSSLTHSHGGSEHTHLPPGTDGSPVTWRSLLALGVSGGLLPCPSALVVLLSAISLHRVGYGLALVVAFSVGLAATLTAIGLLFVYAGRFIKRPVGESKLVRLLPVASALVIACVGAAICYEALAQAGIHLNALAGSLAAPNSSGGGEETPLASLGAFAVLGIGLAFGLKHATEADHVIAVSTIVSEHRSLARAALVGGLWGLGHTASLIVVGVVVLLLRVTIPEQVATWMEFAVGLMIIGLGVNALVRALRGRARAHVHKHRHDGLTHAHLHFHEREGELAETAPATHSHTVSNIGFKPLVVGAAHGLAGSAALTLLVLTQIKSVMLGILYLLVFGVGSIGGMLLMSSLIGLPFAFSARRLSGVNYGLQTVTAALSIAFGLWYASATGVLKLF
jgi:ABC-type nickel/cobalt efflux system permease component RcnA